MIAKRVYLIFISILATIFPAIAQHILYTELPTQDQLPTAPIYRAFQDKEGYMWYGTGGGGLCRDDGYSIKIFRSDFKTPDLLESNWITCITGDNQYRIWFGTKRGLYLLDKKDYQIRLFGDKEIEHWSIDAILIATDGTIWISANHLILHYDATGRKRLGTYSTEWKGKSRPVSQIYEDRSSEIWMIQQKGGVFKFDSEKNDFTPYPWTLDSTPTYFMQDIASPGYWISTWGEGIVYFNPKAETSKGMFSTQPIFSKSTNSRKQILGMLQDTVRQCIWTITADNLYTYRTSETHELLSWGEYEGYSSTPMILNQLISDYNGNIWVPSFHPHTFILSFPKNQLIRHSVPLLEAETGQPALPASFICDKGRYWFCQRRSGLYLYTPENNKLLPVSTSLQHNGDKISPLLIKARDNKSIYTVLNDTNVVRVNCETNKPPIMEKAVCLPFHERIHTLREDAQSCLWIGTSNGLFRYNLLLRQLDQLLKDMGVINDIAIQSDGTVILATEKQGLCIFRPDSEMKSYNKDENFMSVDIAPDQTIWTSTTRGNIYSFHSGKHALTSVTEECGMNGDAVTTIKADNKGSIWMLTDQRIIIYNPSDQSTNAIYSSDPSVAMNSFLSLNKDKDGTIFVGGTGGFCSFLPYEGLNATTRNVPVKLSAIKIDDCLRLPGYAEEEFILQPSEQSIDLFFSTLDHLHAKKIRYAFRYGTNDSWNYLPEGQNNIYLAGLSKGFHTLEIKATDNNGHWGSNSMEIRIQRLPAWYETKWAYTLYILTLIIIACFALRYYMEHKKQKLLDEQIQNSAKDLQGLVCQLSEDILTPAPTDGLDMKSLLVSIQKILLQQKQTKAEVTSTNDEISDNENILSVSDERFVQKALDYIEQNIDNSNYSVELLSKDLGMERTGLYRKLVSIIGKTPTDFIRSIRLKRAALLLEEGYSVSEAADRVGFGTASYLSKRFQKEFGMKPSEYIASLKQSKNKAEK